MMHSPNIMLSEHAILQSERWDCDFSSVARVGKDIFSETCLRCWLASWFLLSIIRLNCLTVNNQKRSYHNFFWESIFDNYLLLVCLPTNLKNRVACSELTKRLQHSQSGTAFFKLYSFWFLENVWPSCMQSQAYALKGVSFITSNLFFIVAHLSQFLSPLSVPLILQS